MPIPPCVVRVRLVRGRRKVLGLWLPVVLLWPVIAALAALAFVVAVPLSLVLGPSGRGRAVLRSVPCLLRLLAATRGLEVDLVDGDRETSIRCS